MLIQVKYRCGYCDGTGKKGDKRIVTSVLNMEVEERMTLPDCKACNGTGYYDAVVDYTDFLYKLIEDLKSEFSLKSEFRKK